MWHATLKSNASLFSACVVCARFLSRDTYRVGVLLQLHEGGELDEAQLVGGDGASLPGRGHPGVRQQLQPGVARRGGLGGLQGVGLARKGLHAETNKEQPRVRKLGM